MDLRKIVDNFFEDYKKDLARLIEIPSVLDETDSDTPFGKAVQASLEEVVKISEEMGFRTHLDPKGHYAFAEVGEGETMFGILGHMDVVPAGDLKSWDTNPFELVEKDGNLVGRGTSDDKGPTLAVMYALKALLDEGYILNQRVRFIFGGDEESLWRCMNAYVKEQEIPSKGFTPDSSFPLIYAEKGLIEFTLTSHEISDVRLEGGGALNAVPAEARTNYDEAVEAALKEFGYRYTVDGDDLVVQGKAMHAKDADLGENALVYLAQALHKAGKTNDMIRFIVEKLADANGRLIYGDVEDEVSGKMKLNVGKAVFRENLQEIGIDIRFPVTYPVDEVKEILRKNAHQYEIVVELFDYLRSIYMEKDSPYIQQLMQAYQSVTNDMVSEPITSGGATYARAMDNIVAFGAQLPGAVQTEHQPNERVHIDSLKTAMEVYLQALMNIVFEKK